MGSVPEGGRVMSTAEYSPEYLQTLQRFRECVKFKPVDRIMHYSNFYTWKYFDSDIKCKFSDSLTDFDLIERIQCEFHERYRFDTHMDLGTRNLAIGPSKILGSSHYTINDEEETINFFDHVIMEGTEYREYADDRDAVRWKMFNRKHPNLTKGQVVEAVIRNIENGEFAAHMSKKFITEYNCPGVYNLNVAGLVNSPIETFHKYYRGIRAMAIDIRKSKKELIYALDKIHEEEMLPALKTALQSDSSAYITDTFTGLLAHATLSVQQWEELYWGPYLKKYFDEIVAAGKTISVYIEDHILRFADSFKEYPKGHIVFIIELDDPFEFRRELPNICIVGGMTSSLLGYGTPEQCVERVKRLAGELGEGFILGQDKMVSFRNDCTRENLLAISDFVRNYRC
jgi:hypothetical protein